MSARASIEALTVSTLRDVATRYLDTDNFVRVTLLPER
jgi:predicted Zn-dependent peptidase